MKTRLFLVLSLLLSGMLSISAQTNDFIYVDCPFEMPEGEIEGETLECGFVTVPESRTGLSDAEIQLAVIALYARGNEELAPYLHLAGGPGNSGTAFMYDFLDHPIRDFATIILFDQRGTGYSDPSLDCWEDDEEDCYERLVDEGVAVDAYRSAENAVDVNDVIEALELESVTIYGISYGTRLALTVMKDPHPAIRAVILDGVYPPNVLSYVEDPINIVRVFTVIFEGCAEDRACNAAFPDLEQVFYAAVEDLNADPLMMDGEKFTGDDFFDELFSMLYDTESIPYTPALVYAAANRDAETIADFFYSDDSEAQVPSTRRTWGDDAENDGNSEGMFNSVDCADEVPFNDVEDIASAIESLGLPVTWAESFYEEAIESMSLCDIWDVAPSNVNIRQATVSAIPTLILNGEYDPVTPPQWGYKAAETLSNSYVFTMPAGGHGVIDMEECPLDIAYQFLLNPMREPDASCIADMPSADWFLDYP